MQTELVNDVHRNKWVCVQESDFLNHNVVPTQEHTLIIDTNLHEFLLNMELRQMSDETDHGVESVGVEEEHWSDGGVSLKVWNRGALCLDVPLFWIMMQY